jgi:outer membrane protein assembly factor BamB
VLNDTGTLTVAKASPDSYQVAGQSKILPGPEAWGPIAIAGGLMLARDTGHLVCLDMRRSP